MYRSIRGRNILSKKAREYYDWYLKTHPSLSSPIALPVKVTMLFHPPRNFRYDVDNYFKNILDCLTKGRILLDDSQIVELRGINRQNDQKKDGYVNVVIKEYLE